MAKQKFTASQVVEALDKHKGMVYLAAEALGLVTWQDGCVRTLRVVG